MRRSLLGVLFMIAACTAFAQRDNVNLLAQSPDGKTVKLAWFFKYWNSDINGFDVRRKEGLKEWVKLNKAPIYPGISVHKKLSVVESDKSEESRVRSRLFRMLSSGKLHEISTDSLLKSLNQDEKNAQSISDAMERDYDVALMMGFGYVDRTIVNKTNYEYGLFITGTDILLDSVIWNYGQIPDLNTVNEITSRSQLGKKGITLMWRTNVVKMKDGEVAGYNVYREGIRLNNDPIRCSKADPSRFVWFDKGVDAGNMTLYSISAQSIFGIEGIIRTYTYNPADHPEEYVRPAITEISSLGFYFKDGIGVKWDFPLQYRRFVKGFYVEKNNFPGSYVRISPLLDSSAASFVDKTPSPATAYVGFRVIAVYNDETEIMGNAHMYSYFPVREPPAPQNLKGKMEINGTDATFDFTWDAHMDGDSLTDYYKIYCLDTINGQFATVNQNPLQQTTFRYSVQKNVARVYRFYCTSVGKNKMESTPADTVSFYLQSLALPAPIITEIASINGGYQLKWSYPEITDVKGFRLYRNDTLIEDEAVLHKGIEKYNVTSLQGGVANKFVLLAVSEDGVISDASNVMSVTPPDR